MIVVAIYLVHHHGLPLEELVPRGRVLPQEEGGEEEEAQEGEADDLFPAKVSQRRPGGWPPRAGLHGHQLGQRQQQRAESLLLAVLHQQAEHREECPVSRVRGEQRDQLMQQVRREHVVCEEWVQC